MNDDGARKLIAAVLHQAHIDFIQNEGCPAICPMQETCVNKDKDHCDAKDFLHSAWSASLCEGLGIEHEQYVAVTVGKGKLNRDTYKYIESELRVYKQTCRELEELKRDIIHESPVHQEGHSYTIGDPTASKAAKIIKDRRIGRYEQIVNAIRSTYDRLDDVKRKVVEMKYWQQRYTDQGICYTLCIDRTTLYRWKKQIIYEIAQELGYL